MVFNNVSEVNFDSLYLNLEGFLTGVNVIAKVEGMNFAGSIKFKVAKAMLDSLEQSGDINSKTEIVESSSGNLGVALAMICAQRGYPFTCVTDPNVTRHNLNIMQAYGAKVVMVEQGADGGFVKNRLKVINQMLAENENLIWTDQYSNSANVQAHKETTATAILNDFPDADYVFMGVGSSGTLMGCCEYFKEKGSKAKIIAVDPDGSVLFSGKSKRRFIPGIGGSVMPKILNTSLVHDYVTVKEVDTVKMCREIVKSKGWLVGGSTGSVLQGLRQYAAHIPHGSTVIVIAPDIGSNYLATIYDDQWVRGMKAIVRETTEASVPVASALAV
ncbi:2,3-diaminopropionate biosynthesis protein SbnA [Pseudoalteromonas rubra]|uniref:cysteine synthase n=1 Tax=Pseudoalteromonas rubra TaxID=43658 RepID=A0A4Q7E4S8_9GAMM|nr:2,3-diaminopropionate biosynthesis protein SbnA [Pseudoalteromonas rubra]RZM76724.1 2,3-diaminopropionate biosynthesis protein SbnA [Pseudoalteromonas rubra]